MSSLRISALPLHLDSDASPSTTTNVSPSISLHERWPGTDVVPVLEAELVAVALTLDVPVRKRGLMSS